VSKDPNEITAILESTATAASLTTMGVTAGQFAVQVTKLPSGKPVVEIAPDNHPIYSLVGRATSAWAHLEHTLDLIIWDLIGLDPKRIACVTAQIIGATNRYNAIESLLGQQERSKFKDILERVKQLIPILTLSNPWLPSRGGRLT
jgi:hypothetical protein